MVNIISSLRSIRFRLILVLILVVSALFFQVFFLVSTQDLQSNFNDGGDVYLENDQIILSHLVELGQITDRLESEQVETILGNILFKEEVDVKTGNNTFLEFTEILATIRSNLTTRQELGYFIESENDDILSQLANIFQNPKFNQSIIDDTEIGIRNLVEEHNSSFTVLRDEYVQGSVDGPLIATGKVIVVDLLKESKEQLEIIRTSHNSNIQGSRGTLVNTTGMVSIISALIDDSLAQLTNETDADELNSKLHMLELFRQISQYVAIVSRFEILNLANENITQAEVEIEIEKLKTELNIRESSILDLSSLILDENQNEFRIVGSIGTVQRTFENVRLDISDALNYSSTGLGRIIENTRNMINEVTQGLLNEQSIFQEQFNSHLDNLDNDLRSQTQSISAIIIIVIFVLIGSTTLTLVRYFNRYERNYRLIGAGNLNIPARKRYSDNEIGRVNQGFDVMVSELKRVLAALQRSSERMAGIAEELAAGSEEASASVQEVANTVREFSAGAAEQNLMLNRVDDKLTEHLKSIEDATRQINETSNFVLKVAKRTNILGLNASIEAAKAGRFGLGFNVVAEEVRNLSTDTKTSALEIADLIEVIETKIQTTIREIQQEVIITKDVAENTAAGSEEANAATSEQVVMLNEISATSNELSLLANELQELLNRFDL